jgi:hypothetical protein
MRLYLFVLAVSCLFTAPVLAQQTDKWALTAQFFHQDDAIDYDLGSLATSDPVHLRPGFTLGVERTWWKSKGGKIRLSQDLHVGHWISPYAEQYSFAGTKLGLEWRLFRQLRLATGLFYRYGAVRPRDVRYVYDGEKWVRSTEKAPAFGRHTVAVDLQLGWRFRPQAAHPFDVYLATDQQFITPFLPSDLAGNIYLFRSFKLGVRVGL